jgi:hypothetical protein
VPIDEDQNRDVFQTFVLTHIPSEAKPARRTRLEIHYHEVGRALTHGVERVTGIHEGFDPCVCRKSVFRRLPDLRIVGDDEHEEVGVLFHWGVRYGALT